MFAHGILQKYGVLAAIVASTLFLFLRYSIFAGLPYGLFYVWRKKQFLQFKIQPQFPSAKTIRSEIANSLVSAGVFGVFLILVITLKAKGFTLIYVDIKEYGYAYLAFSIVVMIFLHDAYFYWMHRLLHHPKLFKKIHQVHHQSHNPTPWASFSFHPVEAVLEFAILPIAVFIFPIHQVAIMGWSLWMISWNVIGHLGFEMFPKNFTTHWIFQWFNTSTLHNLHHEKSTGNFGLYFTFWDRWAKTLKDAKSDKNN